mmetsp:Transcript_45008/g.103340  ORF Transcript_45008/g.103340 Transcript_45008/m.103340 type:complete len:141 (+) Transcript_45008:79-501(+)
MSNTSLATPHIYQLAACALATCNTRARARQMSKYGGITHSTFPSQETEKKLQKKVERPAVKACEHLLRDLNESVDQEDKEGFYRPRICYQDLCGVIETSSPESSTSLPLDSRLRTRSMPLLSTPSTSARKSRASCSSRVL